MAELERDGIAAPTRLRPARLPDCGASAPLATAPSPPPRRPPAAAVDIALLLTRLGFDRFVAFDHGFERYYLPSRANAKLRRFRNDRQAVVWIIVI